MVMPGVFHVEILNTEFMCRNAYIGRKDGHYSDLHIVCRVSAVTATFPWIMGADPPPYAESARRMRAASSRQLQEAQPTINRSPSVSSQAKIPQ